MPVGSAVHDTPTGHERRPVTADRAPRPSSRLRPVALPAVDGGPDVDAPDVDGPTSPVSPCERGGASYRTSAKSPVALTAGVVVVPSRGRGSSTAPDAPAGDRRLGERR
ncbi:hypothetical protein E4N62_16365 [Streptomyces sp. MNU76]|uniref:hypothetical protein n=1 Tax=Streptomyces sp. MNU76 TaxID=2560026 RepID=UPI001E32B44D|nr:hypothetical protein [Streptomyces sp. MNU76]MCC9706706.1 hypothetical protein [Streptomyces sp. MNU76]